MTGRRARRSSGDEALIRSLYNEHGRAVLAYATRLTGDVAIAEDVLQETLIRAWRHPDVLTNGRGSVRGWLLTVTRNIVTDRARARSSRPAEVAESPGLAATGDHAQGVVDMITVLEALEQLSVEHREVLVQIYLQGRTVAEAAEELSVPPGTVKSRSHYALQALRRILGERGERTASRTGVMG
ncbi:sigma-70 family RNA polymerase sigma factor [Lipingzhangella sp. LS1_29]|uniref:Sigma-70 family RNA polymerase sigma factor n=1 Tax=Lipingzhangella rawalii TaxID=2055835 RepID=A0ABU2H914_9ACTN|nr:sigma-70 family RNA polymerase sigma factor [Lipingzhangella rawalii]MDS1271344.1 sigma-70 family RNA polymerase sigma factor [Lipingzhangella rawalii]